MNKPSELKKIRLALGLTQSEFGALLGVAAQSAYARWEAEPNKPAALEALERARKIFAEKNGGTVADLQSAADFLAPAPGPVDRLSHVRQASRIVLGALNARRLSGLLKEDEENLIIDQIADGLTVGRNLSEIEARLGLILDLAVRALRK